MDWWVGYLMAGYMCLVNRDEPRERYLSAKAIKGASFISSKASLASRPLFTVLSRSPCLETYNMASRTRSNGAIIKPSSSSVSQVIVDPVTKKVIDLTSDFDEASP